MKTYIFSFIKILEEKTDGVQNVPGVRNKVGAIKIFTLAKRFYGESKSKLHVVIRCRGIIVFH